MARFVENKHQKGICHDEIGLCDQDIDTILGPIINNWEGLWHHLKRKKIFVLTSLNFCISTLILDLKK